jgi:hypothetical protein
VRRAVPVLAAALLLAGCARALKEPRPLDTLAGQRDGVSPGETEGLLKKAETLYARGDAASIREAAETWLRAAAADPRSVACVLGAVKARVWLADHEAEPAARAEAARSAVETVQWCERNAPGEPACSYWLGIALGVQARERPSTALSALPKIAGAFERAAHASPGIDHGGPDRALALFYVQAPGWPTGPGDVEKGLAHARKAVEIDGDYPPNLLALAEALNAGGDDEEGSATAARALDLARARAAAGEREAGEWVTEAERTLAQGGRR